jgi:hypothetical protein
MTDEDLVLRVLDGETPDSDDARQAELDLARIRRGMELVAAVPVAVPTPAVVRRRRWPAAALAAAAATAGVLALATRDDPPRPVAKNPAPSASASTAPGIGIHPPEQSLAERVAAANRIVVGSVTSLQRGRTPGDGSLPYVLATVAVSEELKPAADGTDEVVAFDYDLTGSATTTGSGTPWQVGDDVLLFLVSDAGTVSAGIAPAHLQVAGGASGRYLLRDGHLDAPFTLDEVRNLVR